MQGTDSVVSALLCVLTLPDSIKSNQQKGSGRRLGSKQRNFGITKFTCILKYHLHWTMAIKLIVTKPKRKPRRCLQSSQEIVQCFRNVTRRRCTSLHSCISRIPNKQLHSKCQRQKKKKKNSKARKR